MSSPDHDSSAAATTQPPRTLSLDDALQEAVAHHRAGRLQEAAALYKAILDAHPAHADANHNLGVVAMQNGRFADSLPHLRAALDAAPGNGQYWLDYIEALHRSGQNEMAWQVLNDAQQRGLQGPEAESLAARLNPASTQRYPEQRKLDALRDAFQRASHKEAVTMARTLTTEFPRNAVAWSMLGASLGQLGHHDAAVQALQTAVSLDPEDANAHCNLGILLKAMNRSAEAEDSFCRAIEVQPEFAEAHNNLGIVLHETGFYKQAEDCYREALRLREKTGYPEACNNLGITLQDLNRPDEALDSFRQAIRLRPGYLDAHNNLGIALQGMGRHAEAEEAFRETIRIAPDNPDAHANLARTLMELGRIPEAETFLDKALALAPDKVRPLATALQYLPYRADDPRFSRLEQLYAGRTALPLRDRINLDFTMGRAMENLGEYDRAFAAYEEGNRLHYAQHPYPETKDRQLLEKTIDIYTAGLLEEYAVLAREIPPPQDDRIPIFIVGMLRSGSTLVEQILASHPMVFGAGELTVAHRIAESLELLELLLKGSPHPEVRLASLRKLGQDYLDEVWKQAPNARCISDKQLGNFCHLGLIHLMLPNAKIIHIVRDPMDSCFSCYATLFSKGVYYSYDQSALGRHYRFYREMMQHWKTVLPAGRFLDVRYEDIVADPEHETRRMLDYLDLPWDPACLRFHETQRVVSTASVVQVRQPIYTQAIARWKRFEKHLTTLRDIVQPEFKAPDAQETATLLEFFNGQRHADAVALAESMTARHPGHGLAWQVMGASLLQLGRQTQALAAMERSTTLAPEDANAHYNRGVVLAAMQRHADAETSFREAIRHKPDHADAHYNLGMSLQEQGRPDEAEAAYRKALRHRPDFVEANNNLGILLKNRSRLEEAQACFLEIVRLRPEDAAARNNLGIVLHDMALVTEAAASYREAIRLRPDYAEARNNLGITLLHLGQPEKAVENYRAAIALRPDYAEAHANLGIAFDKLHRFEEARTCYETATRLRPDYAEAHNNMGHTLNRLGRLADAEACFRHAIELRPDYAEAWSNLLFCLSHREGIDPHNLFAEHLRYAKHFEAPLKAHWHNHTNDRNPDRPLQIGLVSGDLFHHPNATYIEPILTRLAACADIALHIYSNHAIEDSVNRRLREQRSRWHAIAGLSHEMLASKIRTDKIDILIDFSGHTGKNRLPCLARKPAPIQTSWIGYPGTTGLAAMDYFFADRFFLPPGECDTFFTEKIVHLPTTLAYQPDKYAPPVNVLPALRNSHSTFGSFNRPSKIGRPVVALWAQLLRAVPDARMVLGAMLEKDDGEERPILLDWFAEEGIARERLTLLPRRPMHEYLAQYHQVDFCLDTFPFNGSATTGDALWMGVPTLTLSGLTVPARAGAAWQRHFGLEGFIACDKDEFVQLGIAWANRTTELAAIRAGLRDRIRRYEFCRPDVTAAALAYALRRMWQRWCADLPPESFEVPTDAWKSP